MPSPRRRRRRGRRGHTARRAPSPSTPSWGPPTWRSRRRTRSVEAEAAAPRDRREEVDRVALPRHGVVVEERVALGARGRLRGAVGRAVRDVGVPALLAGGVGLEVRGWVPYSCKGPCLGGLGPGSRNFKISPLRRANSRFLLFRVQLNEYYNFGRIEPGRHGCFFGLENGHLRPPIIIFSRCAALVKAAPYGARGNLH